MGRGNRHRRQRLRRRQHQRAGTETGGTPMKLKALASIAGSMIVAGALGCGTAAAAPAAEQGCADLGGTVVDQTCHVHSETTSYDRHQLSARLSRPEGVVGL